LNSLTRKLTIGTVLSVLMFFSISFLTVLLQINSPLHRQTNSNLDIGFPLTYYSQFIVEGDIANSGWRVSNLIIDILLIWAITTGTYLFIMRKEK